MNIHTFLCNLKIDIFFKNISITPGYRRQSKCLLFDKYRGCEMHLFTPAIGWDSLLIIYKESAFKLTLDNSVVREFN